MSRQEEGITYTVHSTNELAKGDILIFERVDTRWYARVLAWVINRPIYYRYGVKVISIDSSTTLTIESKEV